MLGQDWKLVRRDHLELAVHLFVPVVVWILEFVALDLGELRVDAVQAL